MAGDGFAGDASLSGDHPSNPKRGCDVVQGCRVDREEVDREEEHCEKVDREEEHGKEVDREEEHGKEVDREEVDREEDNCQEVDRQAAGCRCEPVAEGRAA